MVLQNHARVEYAPDLEDHRRAGDHRKGHEEETAAQKGQPIKRIELTGACSSGSRVKSSDAQPREGYPNRNA